MLDDNSQKELMEISRGALKGYVLNRLIPEVNIVNKPLLSPSGAFVTLRKTGILRGCIGYLESDRPLYRTVQKMTAAAANDPRFPSVHASELQDISIEISVLGPLLRIGNWRQIAVGRHGVVIRKGRKSGTFLPQVARENAWNRKKFLSELCENKAGLKSDCYQDPETDIFIFDVQIIGV